MRDELIYLASIGLLAFGCYTLGRSVEQRRWTQPAVLERIDIIEESVTTDAPILL